MNSTGESCQCQSCDLFSGVKVWHWHTKRQTDATSMRSALRVWLPVSGVCVFALSICVYIVYVFCVQQCSASLCESHNPVPSGQPCVCDAEGVCVLPCAAPLFHCFTCVVIFRDFSPCCHITIPHWNALILSLVQQPCGDWANIELCCHRTPASLRERQGVVLYCSWSQHTIKLEQTEKCMCVCVLIHFDYKYTQCSQTVWVYVLPSFFKDLFFKK